MNTIYIRDYDSARFWIVALPMLRDKGRKDEVKRALRAFFHREPEEPEARYINEDFDGVIKLFPLPDCIQTEEDANEYFMEYEYIRYRPTYYDCTGQLFTSWYKIFKRGDRFWAYHSIGRDV